MPYEKGDRVTAVANLGGWPQGEDEPHPTAFTLRVDSGAEGTYFGPYSELGVRHGEGHNEDMSEWHLAKFEAVDPQTEGIVDVIVPGHVPAHFIVHPETKKAQAA